MCTTPYHAEHVLRACAEHMPSLIENVFHIPIVLCAERICQLKYIRTTKIYTKRRFDEMYLILDTLQLWNRIQEMRNHSIAWQPIRRYCVTLRSRRSPSKTFTDVADFISSRTETLWLNVRRWWSILVLTTFITTMWHWSFKILNRTFPCVEDSLMCVSPALENIKETSTKPAGYDFPESGLKNLPNNMSNTVFRWRDSSK